MHITSRLDPEALLTLDQAAELSRLDPQLVREAIRDHRLRAEQHKGELLVRVADLRRWLNRR